VEWARDIVTREVESERVGR